MVQTENVKFNRGVFIMDKLKDITPRNHLSLCWPIPGCPAIFEDDSKYYVLVGELMDAKSLGIENRVSDGEAVIKVPKMLIDSLFHK